MRIEHGLGDPDNDMHLLHAALGRFRAGTHVDHGFAVQLMEHLVVPTFVLSPDGRVMIWNKACERLTGVSAAEIIGSNEPWRAFYEARRPCLADLVRTKDYRDIEQLYPNHSAFGMSDMGVSVENWCMMPRLGRHLYLAIDAGPIFDESGSLIAVIETLRDVTVQKEAQRALESLVVLDGLTALRNRRGFDSALDIEIGRAAREGHALSLLMIDIDCFKAFNDNYGHQLGDECLKLVAKTIAVTLRREGDIAARYGGEEFAVILPDSALDHAVLAAESLRQAVKDLQIENSGSPFGHVTLSVGGATANFNGHDAETLLAHADAALYRAKRNGRDQIDVALCDPAGVRLCPIEAVSGGAGAETAIPSVREPTRRRG